VETSHDKTGNTYLVGDWSRFVCCYKLPPSSLLMFHHREDTAKFVIKVFDSS
jgi:hypothetical protein